MGEYLGWGWTPAPNDDGGKTWWHVSHWGADRDGVLHWGVIGDWREPWPGSKAPEQALRDYWEGNDGFPDGFYRLTVTDNLWLVDGDAQHADVVAELVGKYKPRKSVGSPPPEWQ